MLKTLKHNNNLQVPKLNNRSRQVKKFDTGVFKGLTETQIDNIRKLYANSMGFIPMSILKEYVLGKASFAPIKNITRGGFALNEKERKKESDLYIHVLYELESAYSHLEGTLRFLNIYPTCTKELRQAINEVNQELAKRKMPLIQQCEHTEKVYEDLFSEVRAWLKGKSNPDNYKSIYEDNELFKTKEGVEKIKAMTTELEKLAKQTEELDKNTFSTASKYDFIQDAKHKELDKIKKKINLVEKTPIPQQNKK